MSDEILAHLYLVMKAAPLGLSDGKVLQSIPSLQQKVNQSASDKSIDLIF